MDPLTGFVRQKCDSADCFAALVGDRENGCWEMSPRSRAVNIYRHYQDGGLIRETQFENDEGKVALVDCMPVNEANTSIIRLVMGRKGRVAMKTDLVIRVDYGKWSRYLRRSLITLRG